MDGLGLKPDNVKQNWPRRQVRKIPPLFPFSI